MNEINRCIWQRCFRVGLIFLVCAGISLVTGRAALAHTPPRAENGLLDLRKWDFQKMGPVVLSGLWEFYWKQFIPPGNFPDAATVTAPDHLKVPHVWNSHRIDRQRLPGFGYATYRLRIRLAPDPQPLALHMIDAATACAAYVNGQLVFQAGKPGVSRLQSSPSFLPSVIGLPRQGGDLDLVFHVSNYHHREGGLWDRITLGDPAQLHKIRENRIAFNMVLFGSLLLAGLYHLGLYALRRRDLSPLYFGLGCLAILLRTFTTGERFVVQVFPAFPFELLSKLEYLGFYLAVGCFALFGQSLFPKESDQNIIKFITGAAVGFSIVVLLTPLRFYSYTTPAYEIVTLMALLYGFVIMGRALAKKRPGAGIFLTGFIILSATAVNDILYSRQFIHSAYIVQFGLIAFILAQTFLLASRFSQSFDTIEAQQIQLRSSEEKYRLLVDNAGDGIFILQDNAFRFINPRAESLTGFEASDLNTLSFTSLIHPADRAGVRAHLEKGVQATAGITTCSFRLDKRPGASTWVALNTVPTIWEKGPATLNFLRDISHQKKLEDQLRRAQKMEALGTLSGGIALNFNNILGSIVGNAELVIDKLPPDDQRRPYLQQVIAACMKARQMVEQILIFSRKGQVEQHPVNIDQIIAGAVQLLSASIPPTIKIHSHVATGGTTVMANATQIGQLLLNLATNSAQAMQHGGNLYVSLHNLAVQEDLERRAVELAPGHYVRLTVADNGIGIPVDVRERIFDPYFTTKDSGTGTGMGLSVVMGIVKNHKGHIDLVSTPGLGTTFHIYLPAMESESKPGTTPPGGCTPVGWERLFVVGDDERILKVLVEMAEQLGYSVSPFKNAEAALESLHKDSRPYDLVITDLSMPHMAGIEFARRVKDLRPDLPIILCTGYYEPSAADHADMINAVLKKPFYKQELARAIRATLDDKIRIST